MPTLVSPPGRTIIEISAGTTFSMLGFQNVGAGEGVFKDVVGSTVSLKSLFGDDGILVSDGGNDLFIRPDFTFFDALYVDNTELNDAITGALVSYVPVSRTISTTSPLSGGGALSSDLTLTIDDAAADGSTKGAAAFAASDFNSTAGVISIDYTNGQTASGSDKGFLSSADWTTFNDKQAAITGAATTITSSNLTADRVLVSDGSGKVAASSTAASALATLNVVITVLDIGDWNMFIGSGTDGVTVAHGLTLSKIRSVDVMIRDDAGTSFLPLTTGDIGGAGTGSGALAGEVTNIDSTNIYLVRRDGSTFDNTAYDATSYNRGWITIISVP